MKLRPIFLLPLLCVSAAFASDVTYKPMQIMQTEPAVYPREVSKLGLTTGEARVSIQIDENGQLTDHLVTSYTHPKFAESAVNALKRWRYEPAVVNGTKCSATRDLTFTFESKGLVVVDLTVSSYVELRNAQLRPGSYAYAARRLSELDRIPTPTKVVSPAYPVDASNQRRPAVISVFFYIDEQGKVRLPAVERTSSEGNEILASSAIQAVSQWEFEPPTSKGVPVLVAARQEFNFNPNATPKVTSK